MGRIEELVVILIVGLILFGPHKLTDFGKALGGALREFKKAVNGDEGQHQTASATTTTTPSLPAENKASEKKDSSVVS